jgi:hypothetical protein
MIIDAFIIKKTIIYNLVDVFVMTNILLKKIDKL